MIRDLIKSLISNRRFAIAVLSVMVVLATTVLLIFPASALEKDKAMEMGGISMNQTAQDAGDTDKEGTSDSEAADSGSEVEASPIAADREESTDTNGEEQAIEEGTEEPAAGTGPESAITDGAVNGLEFEGEGYTVKVSDPENVLPADTHINVREITSDDDDYDRFYNDALDALNEEKGTDEIKDFSFARFYDIALISGGEEIEPEGGPVSVSIVYDKSNAANRGNNALTVSDNNSVHVLHFAEDKETSEVTAEIIDNEHVDLEVKKDTLLEATFETGSFSVYAIVDAPEPAVVNVEKVQDLDELAQAGENTAFYLSYGDPAKYFTSDLNDKDCFIETTNSDAAAEWHFESAGAANTYYIYCTDSADSSVRHYIRNTSNNNVTLTDDISEADAIVISDAASEKFYLKKNNQNKWLQHSGGGGGIRYYTDIKNTTNSQITISYSDSFKIKDDPYDLDGKSYGIAYQNGSTTAAALMAEAKNETHLVAEELSIKPSVLGNSGILLMAENSDISMWTFRCVEGDTYNITAEVDGEIKYLTLHGQTLTLQDTPDDTYSTFRAIPGTDSNAGNYSFAVGKYYITPDLNGSDTGKGFFGKTNSDNRWLNLVVKSVLDDDDFVTYAAKKVSVSDREKVPDGAKVVIYTRIWNESKKRYEFFVVDHDGTLIPCDDAGDNIEWIGSKINTALWDFTEHTGDDGEPNYFYDLKNDQYGNYIAPQITGDQIFQDDPIGVNLDGRRYGRPYTTIIAWDDDNYSYAALKTENGHIVTCPLPEAQDFYFAIMTDREYDEELATVETVDNTEYGIEMKMFDFNNSLTAKRDSAQTAFLGHDSNVRGLLTTELGDDDYPKGTDKAGTAGKGKSFKELIDMSDGEQDANHLFLKSIYNESGYFEYDSTQNFAHFNEDGNFTVYDSIGAITGDSEHKVTREHGQFMPYNDISVEKGYAIDAQGNVITNRTDVLKNELPDTNTRKGEKMYLIGTNKGSFIDPDPSDNYKGGVDYFYGMEMTAKFTQTESGKDAWGHDIIFEFSGDDDFWFYVDGELILDLGGVHEAQAGSVNFRTGEITSTYGNSTLYETFRKNYQARGLSESEINTKLAEKFEFKDGHYVFKDYTNHTMRMFYMERGGGASNLHMRFNLSAVKPGNVVLSKKLSGTDSESNSLMEFPYQIWYATKEDPEDADWKLVGENGGDRKYVTYKDTSTPVTYKDSLVIGDRSYDHVFLLKPGESANIDLPEITDKNSSTVYKIVECGVNTDAFDHVYVNDSEISGTPAGHAKIKDFGTTSDNAANRPKVDYDNHVSEGAMRTLSITKKLYDVDGKTLLKYPDNDTLFTFRLSLGNAFTDEDNIPPANLYPYFVKNDQDYYCRWDAGEQKFVSLGIKKYDGPNGLSEYLAGLTSVEKESIIFRTSMYGSISKIPAGYTVEVRDLIIGTHWKAQERESEIPKGYTLRLEDGYTLMHEGHEILKNGTVPIVGTMGEGKNPAEQARSPEVDIRNQKGWGLTVNKVWTDKDFMQSHDPIYFAVYVNSGTESAPQYTLLDKSVRQMKSSESSIYYFFDNLQSGIPFDKYKIFEVELTEGPAFHVDPEGKVLGYADISPVSEGQTITIGGTPVGGSYVEDGFTYTVNYEQGEQTTHNENVRTDTVTNSRPGLKLYKTLWDYETPLNGAVFTLKDAQGDDVAASTYTSRESDGLITTAYLNNGKYYLSEIETPKGYAALETPIEITVDEDGISADGNGNYYQFHAAHDDEMASITVRNLQTDLTVRKVDPSIEPSSDSGLAGVHFALYRQVTDGSGNPRKDYLPMTGYEDIVTGENGILAEVNMEDIPAGTYYLTETEALDGYELLDSDLCFTIGKNGKIVINSEGHSAWLSSVTDMDAGIKSWRITVPNGHTQKISFLKVDVADTDVHLAGAEFDLYPVVDGERGPVIYTGLVSDENGLLTLTTQSGTQTVFELAAGQYHLVETKAPSGYDIKEDPVIITINEPDGTSGGDNVTYDEGTTLSVNGRGKSYDEATGVVTLMISNTAGVELPKTGGIGTTIFYVLGSILVIGGGIYFIGRKRALR
ncbi:MAG: LPXTG cell wall anchor domain-containing protein [Clostridiales bacterium]|nr:LPXTG cell wall anchor domain-containing protein [Clostridiales bacterium]